MANSYTNLVRRLEAELAAGFIGREEEARVAVLALLTKQHAVFIGEPGTAKSALIRRLSQLVQCRFFYYLLSKYTVPDELVGAIDPVAYKNGKFVRNVQGKLPQAELAFIDEIFKGSSETLNALLSIMNERLFIDTDGTVYQCPLWSLYGASNELPTDSELAAFYDRFLLRHFVRRIDASVIERAIIHNITNMNSNVKPITTLQDIAKIYDEVTQYMIQNADAISKVVSQLVIVLRQHGIFVSDRTAVSPQHLPRLVATYSYVYGVDLRKAAIYASKYVLPSEDAIENYRKALDELIPIEIREASEKLEKARDYAVAGDLVSAKRYAIEAYQAAEALLSNPDKAKLFKDEIREILNEAEAIATEIKKVEDNLKKFKRVAIETGSY
ncbi:MAG: AAA family ATPase [Ignisphaera sp.]